MKRLIGTLMLFAAGTLTPEASRAAGPEPGLVIDTGNVETVKDLISPGLEWTVRHGMTMRVIEPRHIEWPKAYREATEKYAGQVQLGADGITLENYVAGQPFPHIDPALRSQGRRRNQHSLHLAPEAG